MPTVRPGYLTQTPVTTFGLGRSDSASLRAAYPTAPQYTDYTDAAVRTAFSRPPELTGDGIDAVLSDGGYAYGSVPRNYRDAPNLAEVVVGGGGKPGSPYGPNIATPADGHNPASIPASGVEATERARSHSPGAFVGGGADNIVSPSTTTRGIVPRTLGQNLINGVGSGNSYRIRIT